MKYRIFLVIWLVVFSSADGLSKQPVNLEPAVLGSSLNGEIDASIARYKNDKPGEIKIIGDLDGPKASPIAVTGGLVSMALGGITDFLLERAREEAIAFVMDQIGKGICKHQLCREDIFKNICALTSAVNQSDLDLNPGRMFYQAVRQDLHGLPDSIADALESKDINFDGKDLIACGFKIGYGIHRGLQRRLPPETMIIDAVNRLGALQACKNALDMQAANHKAFEAYELVRSSVRLLMWVLIKSDDLQDIQKYSLKPSELVDTIMQEVEKSNKNEKEYLAGLKVTLEHLAPICIRLVKDARELRNAEKEELITRVEDVFRSATEILFTSLLQSHQESKVEIDKIKNILVSVQNGVEKVLSGDFAGGMVAVMSIAGLPKDQEPFKSLFGFSALLVDIAGAQNSQEITVALERAAAPAGSWRLRRKQNTIGLGALFGVGAGYEKLTKPGVSEGNLPAGFVSGMYLPIGFQASTPVGSSCALGVMLQFIDIGALGQAWITDNEDELKVNVEPEIGFMQVFAPGLQIFFGLWNTPFTVSVGAEYVFEQRGVVANGNEKSYNALRIGANLAVDVPIFLW